MSKTYLAGPMSGKVDFNRAEFIAAAERLRSWGHEVHSPVEMDVEVYGTWEAAIARPWQEHLARDVAVVPTCDTIALMRGWEESTGAQLELHIAQAFKLNVISAEDGLDIPESEYAGMTYRTKAPTLAQTAFSRGEPTQPAILRDYPPRGVGPATAASMPRELLDSLHDEDAARNQAELGRSAFVDAIELTRADIQRRFFEHQEEEFESYESNPLRQRQESGAVKDNKGKSRVDLIPSKPLIGVGHVLAFGARKYKPGNWRLGLKWSDTLASIYRHLFAFADGEDLDPETGLPHVDQALCQTLFLSEYYHAGTGTDDRWSSSDHAESIA